MQNFVSVIADSTGGARSGTPLCVSVRRAGDRWSAAAAR
jgi:hypothetical protein